MKSYELSILFRHNRDWISSEKTSLTSHSGPNSQTGGSEPGQASQKRG